MKDFLGNKIKTGDVIAYSAKDGNSSVLRSGYVHQINEDGTIGIYILGGGYVKADIDKLTKTKLHYGSRIVIIDRKVNFEKLKEYVI